MERKVGSLFKKGNKLFEVIQTNDNICNGCYYEKSGGSRKDCALINDLGECHQLIRTDNKSVIFKIKKV